MVNYCFTNKKIPSSIPIPSRRVELPSEEMEALDLEEEWPEIFQGSNRFFLYGYPEKNRDLLSEDVFLQGKTTSHELVFGESLQGPTMFDGTNPRGFFSNFYGNSIIHICVSLTYLISQENITNIRLKLQQSARRRNLTREKQANIGPKQKSSSKREFTLNIQETI